jgi:hypothetical protein
MGFSEEIPSLSGAERDRIMTKGWLVGFIEAEGSFYITRYGKTQNGTTRWVHGFGVSQKLDPIVLECIRRILHISSKVRYRKKHDFYILDTTQKRAINNICAYFQNNLKGSKSLEFKLWKKSMGYSPLKLEKTQTIMRKLRKRREDILNDESIVRSALKNAAYSDK